MTVAAPVLLGDGHQFDAFDCGGPALDGRLKRRARGNAASGASYAYVGAESNYVVGYHALADGAVEVPSAPGRFRHRMPDPIPIVVIKSRAVDRCCIVIMRYDDRYQL